MRVLVVNAGSSSLKLSVLDGERTVGEQDAVSELLEAAGPVDAVGHRVVHGGPDRAGAALLNDGLVDALAALTPLTPLHQPRAVAGIRSLRELLPDLPAVACFDTAFHHGLPAAARTDALPREWNARWRLRRFGFHGLSHAYAVRRAAHLVHRDLPGLRVLSCHLGAGASLCGVAGGASVDTTMGFTPMEGLVMRTRSGSVDPGLLLWLQEHGGVDAGELADTLNHRSGLAGLSGTSGDLRDVPAAATSGDAAAQLAYDVFVHRLAREAAGMTAATGGLDLLVLTGGLGEHSVPLRRDLAGGSPTWACRWTTAATRASTATPTSAPPAPPCAPWWWSPARTCRSRPRCGHCWPGQRRTTRTGHGACCATWVLVDPSSTPAKPPRPREPTTSRSWGRAAATSSGPA
ncbi:MAG: Acetate kinase [Frankiales bacterium]|nr:Acetate kinase [Frankiales bacterium]